MKSNIIKISLTLIATVFIFTGCNDDFLERYPLDEISAETFWNTENDLRVYNNRIYDRAKEDVDVPILMGHDDGFNSHRYGIWHTEGFSDNTAPRHSRHTRYQQVRAGKHNVPSSAQWYGYRNNGWGFIRTINIGLANYDKAAASREVIDKYVGEARFFRGWFYADKVSKFGDAPWLDKELNIDSPELDAARTPREEVMNNVLADLNFATSALPDDWGDGGAPGRINRWCALLIKSRICLFEGTWRKYHGGSGADMWLQEAASAAKEVMDSGVYELYSTGDPANDYNAIHKIKDDLSGVPEVMYWRRYERGIYTNHVQSYHRAYNGGATKSLVEDYLCTDGLPITLSPLYQGDAQIEDAFENRDPRLRQSVLHPADISVHQYNRNDLTRSYPRLRGMNGGLQSETGYHIIKVYEVGAAHATYNTSTSPAIVMRYGEALLNYAEAMAELGTITQGDIDITINALRDRVGMPHLDMGNVPVDPRYTSDGVSPLIAEIRRERRVELFMEGFRYDDIRRWKQGKKLTEPDLGIRMEDLVRYEGFNGQTTMVDGVTYVDVYKGTDWEGPVFDENKHYLWPIPLSTISQNPNVQQNPNW